MKIAAPGGVTVEEDRKITYNIGELHFYPTSVLQVGRGRDLNRGAEELQGMSKNNRVDVLVDLIKGIPLKKGAIIFIM